MKKVMFLMAVAGMFAFAACNNNAAEPAVVDTPVVGQPYFFCISTFFCIFANYWQRNVNAANSPRRATGYSGPMECGTVCRNTTNNI